MPHHYCGPRKMASYGITNGRWSRTKKIDSCIDTALAGRRAGTMMPFAITRRDTGKVVGTTRLWKIDRSNRTLEIGNTWLGQSAQRTSVNTETKFLLLTHGFFLCTLLQGAEVVLCLLLFFV